MSVEPVAEVCGRLSWDCVYTMKAVMVLPTGSGLFTLDQLTTAIAAARVQALEDFQAIGKAIIEHIETVCELQAESA